MLAVDLAEANRRNQAAALERLAIRLRNGAGGERKRLAAITIELDELATDIEAASAVLAARVKRASAALSGKVCMAAFVPPPAAVIDTHAAAIDQVAAALRLGRSDR